MSMTDPYVEYMQNQIRTASPAKLLIMLYDAAIRFARIALEKMKERKLDEQSANIRKAQDALLELMSALDYNVDQQLAVNLDALYTYMFDRLTHANIRDDEEALNEVIEALTEMREAWVEADQSLKSGGSASRQVGKAA